MYKQEFLDALKRKLSGLPKQDVEDRLTFYSEMIDDKMEDGKAEKDAVLEIGCVDEISAQIIADIPLSKIAKERLKINAKPKAWEIVLLALGSPIWLSPVIAAFAVCISLYAVLWSVIISIWAAFVSLAACVLGGVIAGIVFTINGNTLIAMAMLGASIICAGLAIFLFFGCKAATNGSFLLTKKIAFSLKKGFMKKENAQ
jgi:uncharacterized membrane protein